MGETPAEDSDSGTLAERPESPAEGLGLGSLEDSDAVLMTRTGDGAEFQPDGPRQAGSSGLASVPVTWSALQVGRDSDPGRTAGDLELRRR